MPAHRYVEENGLAAILATKRSAGSHTRGESQGMCNHMPPPGWIRLPTLALKPWGDITEVQTGVWVASQKGLMFSKFFKKIKSFFYIVSKFMTTTGCCLGLHKIVVLNPFSDNNRLCVNIKSQLVWSLDSNTSLLYKLLTSHPVCSLISDGKLNKFTALKFPKRTPEGNIFLLQLGFSELVLTWKKISPLVMN